ncbi:MAG: geranylgeranyl reductase family protein [Bacillota bacterium]
MQRESIVTADVVVIGGGPAGSSAAARLAELGLDVMLLERGEEGAAGKPCGGYLPQKALRLLDGAELADLLQQGIRTVSLQDEAGRRVRVTGQRQPLGYLLEREVLDRRLQQWAAQSGARVSHGERLLGVHRWGRRHWLQTNRRRLRCRYLIGADGTHSPTAHLTGLRAGFPRWQLAFATLGKLKWKGLPRNWREDEVRLYCYPLLGGMGWAFPLPGGANVGVAGSALELAQVTALFERHLAHIADQHGPFELVARRGGWLPAGGFPRQIAKGNVLLCGDAAGFVDSFSGEGIYYALLSGHLAANAIAVGYGIDHLVRRFYRQDCSLLIMPSLRQSLLLSGALGHRKDWLLTAMRRDPRLACFLARLMEDQQPYRGQVGRLLLASAAAGLWGAWLSGN